MITPMPDTHEEKMAEQQPFPESIGPYRIKRKIGQGGMGTVLEAVHETLERPVALKILPPEFSANPEYVSRFLREARVIATLRHENVVQVYDAGVQDGRYFIAMELMEGIPFAEYLEQHGTLDAKEGLDFLLQAAKGLAAAHDKELVHRDIKPDNLLLDKDHKTLRIVDFGLVMESASTTQLTATGACLGTPQFMSPEQADGEKADGRTDIYSLGVTFYRAFTGEIPFSSPTVMNLLFKHKFEAPPDPRKFKPSLPKNVCHLILTMMAKSREERPQNAHELVALIERAQQGKRIPAPPAFESPLHPDLSAANLSTAKPGSLKESLERMKWPLLGGAAAGVLLLTVLGFFLFGKTDQTKDPPKPVAGNVPVGEEDLNNSTKDRGQTANKPAVDPATTDPYELKRNQILEKARQAEGLGQWDQALAQYRAADALGAKEAKPKISMLMHKKLIAEAKDLEAGGDFKGALAKAREAAPYGDTDALVADLKRKTTLHTMKATAEALELKNDFVAAAEQYEAAAQLAEDKRFKEAFQKRAQGNRRKGFLGQGRQAEEQKNWAAALAAYAKAQKIQNDPLLEAKLVELKKKATEDPAFRANLSAGDQAITEGKALLDKKEWETADRKFIQARALYLKAYDAKKTSPVPGQKMKEAEGCRALCRGDIAFADARLEEARQAYSSVSGIYPPLAATAEARLAKLPQAQPKPKPTPTPTSNAHPTPDKLEAEVLALVSAHREREAMQKIAGVLSNNPTQPKALQLKSALENLQACGVIYKDLKNILDSSLTVARDASEVDSLGGYIRSFKESINGYKEEAEEGLALDHAKFRNKNYSGLGISVRNARSLARTSAAKMQNAHDLYKEKGDKLDAGTRVKVPFFGWKINEPTARDREKAAKLQRIARSFNSLERKAQNLGR